MGIENFIVASNACSTVEELFGHLREEYRALGFDSVIYNLLNDHPSMGLKARPSIVSSYPQSLVDHWLGNDLMVHDPLQHFCFASPSAFAWHHVQPPELTRGSQKFLDAIYNIGLTDAVGVPIHGPNSELACLGLATPHRVEDDPNRLSTVQALGVQFHVAYGRLCGRTRPRMEALELTPREREILMWSAEGKSVYAIAEILSVSENTVKFHLKNIYRKLGVGDRLQAVLRAIYLGLISPPNVRRIPTLPR